MIRFKFILIFLLLLWILLPQSVSARCGFENDSTMIKSTRRPKEALKRSGTENWNWQETIIHHGNGSEDVESTAPDAGQKTGRDDISIEDRNSDEENATERGPTLSKWPEYSISEITIDPRETNKNVPQDRSGRLIQKYSRNWNAQECCEKVFMWEAPNIHYFPLYFENVSLERYGQSRNEFFQTAVSAAHFFSSTFLLPLHARTDPAYSFDSPLGYCRPGNCTQRIFQRQFWH